MLLTQPSRVRILLLEKIEPKNDKSEPLLWNAFLTEKVSFVANSTNFLIGEISAPKIRIEGFVRRRRR